MWRAQGWGPGPGPGAACAVEVLCSRSPGPESRVCTRHHTVLPRSGTRGTWPREDIWCWGRWNCSFFKDVPRAGEECRSLIPEGIYNNPWNLTAAHLNWEPFTCRTNVLCLCAAWDHSARLPEPHNHAEPHPEPWALALSRCTGDMHSWVLDFEGCHWRTQT